MYVQAVSTAHSYLHSQLPDMPFLHYSRPATGSSGHHSNAPSAVTSWDVLPIITQWANDADDTQAIDQPRLLRSLRRLGGTAKAAVTDAVQQLLLTTSDFVEAQFLVDTGMTNPLHIPAAPLRLKLHAARVVSRTRSFTLQTRLTGRLKKPFLH